MSTRNSIPPCTSRFYRITVEGKIDPSWSEWLAGMELVTRKETDGISVTTLSGILIDQAALRGLLNRLWDLNLILRSIDHIHPAQISNK